MGYQPPPQTITAWVRIMREASKDLDLTDPDDRAAYRLRIEYRANRTRTSLIRALAAYFGATAVPASRSKAAHALANTYIAGQR